MSELMKRPYSHDDYVLRRAAERAIPALKEAGLSPRLSDSEIMRDLTRCLCYDAFQTVKGLEHLGWSGTSSLVGFFEDYDFLEEALTELTTQWVRCLRIVLEIPVGASVEWFGSTGIVIDLLPHSAKYGVRFGEQRNSVYRRVPAEEITLLAVGEAER